MKRISEFWKGIDSVEGKDGGGGGGEFFLLLLKYSKR